MAHYIFVKTRQSIDAAVMLGRLTQVCDLLTPKSLKADADNYQRSQNSVSRWPDDQSAFYAIQNSAPTFELRSNRLLIGWMQSLQDDKEYGLEADGSYAVIHNIPQKTTFFSDQFGSRTLWYCVDEDSLILSTSQRAVVALKGSFDKNDEALAWYLSAGCQGAFLSWDTQVQQVLPQLKYGLDVEDWRLDITPKPDRDLPLSGSTKWEEYLTRFNAQVSATLVDMIDIEAKTQTLLPISGGYDSRLLLALSKKLNLINHLTLVNWGVAHQSNVLDDKAAAKHIAKFYEKTLLDKSLPAQAIDHEEVLTRFVHQSEGRIDHFNAFTDGFTMWDEFYQQGYRTIIRGDIPYPTGLCLNERQMREKVGMARFTDFDNRSDFAVEKFIDLQNQYPPMVQRLKNESLIRWRDRIFATIRVPTVFAAFSQQISSYIDNQNPMMSWSLYQLYMGLPDKQKGNKRHIKALWRRHDRSHVATNAKSALRSMDSYFDTEHGRAYLLNKLSTMHSNSNHIKDGNDNSHLSSKLMASVYSALNKQTLDYSNHKPRVSFKSTVAQKAKDWLSNHLPAFSKAYLKSKQANTLSATTLAYRLVMADKIITMYESDAIHLKEEC